MYAVRYRVWNGDASTFYWFDNKDTSVSKFQAIVNDITADVDESNWNFSHNEYQDFIRKALQTHRFDLSEIDDADYTLVEVIKLVDGKKYKVVN